MKPKRRTWIIRRLLVTTAKQGGGAPIIDGATSGLPDGRKVGSYLILPPRIWRKPRMERPPVTGLVLGWIGARPAPLPPDVLLRRLWRRVRGGQRA